MTKPNYPIPAEETRREIRVANSRFIATIAPIFSIEEARAFVARVKSEFADASHNVPAYVIGGGAAVIAHCNDDGEPSGTAGRPALAVLQGSGLGDAAVVITRYFGGTKLGKGGLVRAYGDAVRSVLEATPLAEKVATQTARLALPYPLFERARLLVAEHGGEILSESFTADVTIEARFRAADISGFEAALQELSNGMVAAEIVETGETIMMIEQQGGNNG